MRSREQIVADPRAFFVDRLVEQARHEAVVFTPDEEEYLRRSRVGDDDRAAAILKKMKGKPFDELDKKLSELIDHAHSQDLVNDVEAKEKYKAAMESLAGVDEGPNLSMFVSGLVFRPDFQKDSPLKRLAIIVITLALLALGAWIGFHLRQ